MTGSRIKMPEKKWIRIFPSLHSIVRNRTIKDQFPSEVRDLAIASGHSWPMHASVLTSRTITPSKDLSPRMRHRSSSHNQLRRRSIVPAAPLHLSGLRAPAWGRCSHPKHGLEDISDPPIPVNILHFDLPMIRNKWRSNIITRPIRQVILHDGLMP